ncbi:MAG: hydantoinase/oxoprolinase family protein [Proteobacteria bacterium]|nr:hydantoinase/oxoprolinase family protein [Pseudomonadota bacterium]
MARKTNAPGEARPVLGIDVGGTNTDAVLMVGREVLASAKRATTAEVGEGLVAVVEALLRDAGVAPQSIGSVMIGTTQFINAFVQRRGLARVAAVRVSAPKGDGVPPFAAWPRDLLAQTGEAGYFAQGGAFFDGRDYAPLDPKELERIALDIRSKGIRAVAVSSCFAPARPDIEREAARMLTEAYPEADITLSAEVGGLGIVDRENAAIMNGTLRELAARVVAGLSQGLRRVGISSPVFFSQNDGTLISAEFASRFPVFTCSAGPTNSLRGAAFLTGLEDALVMDIGGTTTDLGFLVHGFPRESALPRDIGGVLTNSHMPDILSIALGGGTLVRESETGLRLGPESVGYQLTERALVFGGTELTATDIAVRAGQARIGDPSKVSALSTALVERAVNLMHERIEDAIDRMKTNSKPVPVILVGGGHILLSRPLRGTLEVHRPRFAEVANAVGAAIAMVSGRVDRLYDYSEGRDAALQRAKDEASQSARAAGADPGTITIVELSELPMTHIRTNLVQVRVRAVGELASLRS